MTLELLVQHPVYTHLVKFASSTEAREKLLRLLQYFVRFLRALKFQQILTPQLTSLLPSLQATFTLARKPLRASKPLNHLKAFSICISDQLSDPILRYSEALKQFGLFFFLSFDTIQWIKMLGLLGGKGVNDKLGKFKFVKNIKTYAALMWCISLIGGLIKNLRQFQILITRSLNNTNNNTNNNELKAPYISLKKVKRDFVKNVLDLIIAANLYHDFGTGNGIVGSCGVITSIIATQDLWHGTA